MKETPEQEKKRLDVEWDFQCAAIAIGAVVVALALCTVLTLTGPWN